MLDTGAENDGVDEMTIFGRDFQPTPEEASDLPDNFVDDIFLMRAASYLPGEAATFNGTLTFGDDGTNLTLTRSGGSFIDDGFVAGQFIDVNATTTDGFDGNNGKYQIDSATDLVITLTALNASDPWEETGPSTDPTMLAEVTAESEADRPGYVALLHGTLAHNDMEIMRSLREVLHEEGIASLAVTLSLGVDDRSGMYDCNAEHRHRHTDAIGELEAWRKWLVERGYPRQVLLGHSRGGNQVAWYLTQQHPQSVVAAVLVAPQLWQRDKAAAAYAERFGVPLQAQLDRAEQLRKSAGDDGFLCGMKLENTLIGFEPVDAGIHDHIQNKEFCGMFLHIRHRLFSAGDRID